MVFSKPDHKWCKIDFGLALQFLNVNENSSLWCMAHQYEKRNAWGCAMALSRNSINFWPLTQLGEISGHRHFLCRTGNL